MSHQLTAQQNVPFRHQDFPSAISAQCRLDLTEQHCPFKISSAEFDAVAQELALALDFYKVPAQEKSEVLAAFAAHKSQVTHCSEL